MNDRSPEPVDVSYELIVTDAGLAYLTCGGEVVWSSDADDTYDEEVGDEFIDVMDEEQCDAIIDWLQSKGYIPPDVDVSTVREEDQIDGQDV